MILSVVEAATVCVTAWWILNRLPHEGPAEDPAPLAGVL